MAKSKSKAVVKAKPSSTPVQSEPRVDGSLTTKATNGTPYQLDPAQVERAASALVKHMKQHAQENEERAGKKNLAADEDEPEENDLPIFLTLATKQHVKDSNRLKPNKIALPNSIQSEEVRICLITADPQRQYKDIVAEDAFPESTRSKVNRVIGLEKLKKKYKTYETKRQLLAEYDIFLADDRVLPELPRILGKIFNSNKAKRPIPVSLAVQLPKDKDGKRKRAVRKPEEIAKEIESALTATYVHLSPTATTSIRVGKLSQTPEQLKENIEAVVAKLTEKFVPQGWKNVRALHIKGPTTQALPIWLADELWTDEIQVLEEAYKPAIKEGGSRAASEKKRKWDEWAEEMLDDEEFAELKAKQRKNKKSKSRTEGEGKSQSSISKENRKKLKEEALKAVQVPLITG